MRGRGARPARSGDNQDRGSLRRPQSLTRILILFPVAALALATLVSDEVRQSMPLQVSGHQDTLYATVAGVGATLLGFLIAAIALLAVLPPANAVVRQLQTQGLLRRAVTEISRASFAMALFM